MGADSAVDEMHAFGVGDMGSSPTLTSTNVSMSKTLNPSLAPEACNR